MLITDCSELYYATSNLAKFEEVAAFFKKHLPHIALMQCAEDFYEIQTLDQREIALNKAQQAWSYLKKPVMVDDSGIYFEKYSNFPGTMTKFVYQSLGFEGMFKLIAPGEKTYFKLTIVFMYGDNEYNISDYSAPGILVAPRNLDLHREDAPFDTIYIPEGTDCTMNELRVQGKAAQHHYRIKGLEKLISQSK